MVTKIFLFFNCRPPSKQILGSVLLPQRNIILKDLRYMNNEYILITVNQHNEFLNWGLSIRWHIVMPETFVDYFTSLCRIERCIDRTGVKLISSLFVGSFRVVR